MIDRNGKEGNRHCSGYRGDARGHTRRGGCFRHGKQRDGCRGVHRLRQQDGIAYCDQDHFHYRIWAHGGQIESHPKEHQEVHQKGHNQCQTQPYPGSARAGQAGQAGQEEWFRTNQRGVSL